MSDQWSKIQHIEKGVEIIPLRDPSLCDEWVLREEADQRIAELEIDKTALRGALDVSNEREKRHIGRIAELEAVILKNVDISWEPWKSLFPQPGEKTDE